MLEGGGVEKLFGQNPFEKHLSFQGASLTYGQKAPNSLSDVLIFGNRASALPPSKAKFSPLQCGRRGGWEEKAGQRADIAEESSLQQTSLLCIEEPEKVSQMIFQYRKNSTLVPFLKQIAQ